MRVLQRASSWISRRPGTALAVLLAVVVLPVFLFTYLATRVFQQEEEEQALAEARQVSRLSNTLLAEELRHNVVFLQALAARPRFLEVLRGGDQTKMGAQLEQAHALRPDLAFIQVSSRQGELQAISPAAPQLLHRDLSGRDWYRGVTRTLRPYISTAYEGPFADGPPSIVAIAVPIRDQAGEPLGILVCGWNTALIASQMQVRNGVGSQWEITLVDQRGGIAARSATSTPGNLDGYEPIARLARGQSSSGVFNRDGKQYFVATDRVPEYGWGVIVEQPAHEALVSLNQVRLQMMVLCIVFGAGAVLFVGVVAPLYQQLDTANRFFNMSLDPLAVANLEGRFVKLNTVWKEVLGYEPEELTKRPYLDFVHPEDREATVREAQKLANNGHTVRFENRYRHADGHYVWLMWNAVGVPSEKSIYAIAHDMTEKKQAEAVIRESEVRHRALFESSPFPMWVFAVDDLRFLQVNQAAIDRYGYSREEFLAMTIKDIRPSEDVPRLMTALGPGSSFGVWRHRRKDGAVIDVEVSSQRITVNERPVELVVAEEVTERLRARREIETQNAALQLSRQEAERANQMKSQFLANMSHELRTPLNAILGFSELLEDQGAGPLNEKQERFVKNIRGGARHLLQLINDILDLAKIEAGQLDFQFEDFRLHEPIPEVMSLIRPLAMGKRVALVAAKPDPTLVVRADRTRLKQVLYNLLSNAVKFTPEGGRITIDVGRCDGLPSVTVSDTGTGIPAEELEAVFEEFRQLGAESKKAEGTGLGLAITRRLVENQGGRILVASEVGVGSRFTVVLPAGTLVEAPLPAVQPERAITRPKPLILVVDDDAVARHLLLGFLEPEGFEVRVATDGSEAVRLALELQPDAITLDLLMPESGWKVLSELKRDVRTAEIPVIVVSIVDEKTCGYALGAADYLVKPVSRDTLLRALQRQLVPARPNRRILVIDDNPRDLQLISEVLSSVGFLPQSANGGVEGLKLLHREKPDGVLLDLLMPEMDGFAVLEQIKADESVRSIPVFILTAKDLSAQEEARLVTEAQALLRKSGPWKEDLLIKLRQVLMRPGGRR